MVPPRIVAFYFRSIRCQVLVNNIAIMASVYIIYSNIYEISKYVS